MVSTVRVFAAIVLAPVAWFAALAAPAAAWAQRAGNDAAARCTKGIAEARRGDLTRAALHLDGCDRAELPDELAARARRAARDVKRRLDVSRLSPLDIVTQPEGLTAEIDDLPGESFAAPATVWVAPGKHVVRARQDGGPSGGPNAGPSGGPNGGASAARTIRTWTRQVTTEPHKTAVVVIETGLGARPAPPKTRSIDMSRDDPAGALGEQYTAPPPDIKHPSLMSDKYRGIPGAAAGPAIDDPLAKPPQPPQPPPPRPRPR